jgi:hypothetical protein
MNIRFGLRAPPVLIEPDSPLCKKRKSPPVPSSISVIISGSAWCDDDDQDDQMTLSLQRKDSLPDFSSLRKLSITASPLPPIKMQLIQVGEGDDSPKDNPTKTAVSKLHLLLPRGMPLHAPPSLPRIPAGKVVSRKRQRS